MRVVAKFGGTSLGSGERINRAADSVTAAVEAGHEIAVVVSAMGSTTDHLLQEIQFEVDASDRAEIVSMGERTAARMVKAALSARGVESEFLDPGDGDWPVVTDSRGEVDVEETTRRARALADRLGDVVPIIAGFIAEDHAGTVTTLGRGGSDTTAMMLGNYMDADEVAIVTDVEGVMTGDPRVVEGARNVGEISVDELRNLSLRGAEVIAPSALNYTHPDLGVRVVHYQHGDLLHGGTNIEGTFETLIDLQEAPLSCLTVAGRAIRNRPGILATLSGALAEADINIDATASGLDSITFYVYADDATEAETVLHERVIEETALSSVTVDEEIAAIRITGGELPTQSGIVQSMVERLADERIAVHDVITSATSIAAFVDWDAHERALTTIQDTFD